MSNLNDDQALNTLRSAAKAVVQLTEHPQPGMSTWHLMLRDKCVALRDMLQALFGSPSSAPPPPAEETISLIKVPDDYTPGPMPDSSRVFEQVVTRDLDAARGFTCRARAYYSAELSVGYIEVGREFYMRESGSTSREQREAFFVAPLRGSYVVAKIQRATIEILDRSIARAIQLELPTPGNT